MLEFILGVVIVFILLRITESEGPFGILAGMILFFLIIIYLIELVNLIRGKILDLCYILE
ncbi:MAG: hypothetical protein ISS80_00435 [Candidatus Cloacimonetes bacterium]|nr:hypothetical protein [Candidatus Cloacimonadota bacterium]